MRRDDVSEVINACDAGREEELIFRTVYCMLSWADLYGKSSFGAKKMIVSQFIKAVRVGRDYNIEVDFNVSFEELQGCRTDHSGQEKMQVSESRTT